MAIKANQIIAQIIILLFVGYMIGSAFQLIPDQYNIYKLFTKTNSDASSKNDNKLDTTISPARDLTGEWEGLSGSAKWHDNVGNPACSYEGFFHLTLDQKGNDIGGTFTSTITKVKPAEWNKGEVPCSQPGEYNPFPLTGTVSSAGFKFQVATINFIGTYTTDTIKGTFNSCPNQICSDGTRGTGWVGEFELARQK